MTAAMTRLPSESFWPAGAESEMRLPFPSLTSDLSSAVISPLTLPRGATGYFDQITAKSNPSSQVASASQMPSRSVRGSRVYSPLSPGGRGSALPQLPQFLSPHLGPVGRDGAPQHRSTSLPPTHREAAFLNRPRTNTATTPRAVAALGLMQGPMANGTPPNGAGAVPNGVLPPGHPRTISTDSTSAPSQASMIRRLVQQNGRIREAWEAERKYLEANRERAEEVYKEERALMEEERAEWEAEKVSLLQEIELLQQRILSLGGTVGRPRDASVVTGSKYALNPSQSLRGGGWETSPESLRSSTSSQSNGPRNGQTIGNAVSLPQLHTDGPPNRSLLGTELPAFRAASSTELPVVPEVESGPVPIVDVQEIHPELEGIPIKANTIQKPTFTFTDSPSQNGSRPSSPPSSSNRPKISSQGSKEQTLQVLAAEESVRLTMHAGHTPSHSLSLIPTVSSSGAHTASSSGESTPTVLQADGVVSQGLVMLTGPRPAEPLIAPVYPDPLAEYHHEPERLFEPAEDQELKGPLMVRNMPAHDEIFFRRLSDKLEEVSRDDQAALPAVLKDREGETGDQPKPEVLEAKADAKPEAAEGPQDGASSAASDSGTENSQSSPKSGEEQELDIPLKLKSSMNFGAPFGTFR